MAYMLVYHRVYHGVKILFEGCSGFNRLSMTGAPRMGGSITIGYMAVQWHIKISAVDWHVGLRWWSESVRYRNSCTIEMVHVTIVRFK